MPTDFRHLMRQFAGRHGFVLGEPSAGRYRLSVDDRLEVSVLTSGRQLLIESPAGRLGGANSPATQRRLMGLMEAGLADLLDHEEVLTLESELASDRESGSVAEPVIGKPVQNINPDISPDINPDVTPEVKLVLFRRLSLDDLMPDDFETALEQFLNHLERWQRRLMEAPAPLLAMPHVLFP